MSGTKPPSNEEEEYFARIEREQREKLRERIEADAAAEEARRLKELHWMRCAKCGGVMETHQFRGVAIEQCPSCGGVYLDAGELETLAGEERGGMVGAFAEFFGVKRFRRVGEKEGEGK